MTTYTKEEVLEIISFIRAYVPQKIRSVEEGNLIISKLLFIIDSEMNEVRKYD